MYQGHANDGSSIQKHSCGPQYPFVVYEKGDIHKPSVHVMYGDADIRVPCRAAASSLVQFARILKSRSGQSYADALSAAARLLHFQPSAA